MATAEFVVDFPTLWVAADWIPQHTVIPDGFDQGDPFDLVDWQLWSMLNFYRLKPKAKVGQLAPAFAHRRGQIVLPQKAGKAPYTSAHICVEAVGPALFGGWAKGGETWDCRDHGCGCGWIYEYEPGEAMAMQWPTPLIQITAYSEDQTDNIYDALRPMIDGGPLAEQIPKTGEEFIRLPNRGRIDVVTSKAQSRLGQRVTFVPQDETGIWLRANGMIKVAETQRRGLSGMGGRAEETTNGWDPSEESVAQRTAESKKKDIFRYHPEAPKSLNYRKKADRRKIHKKVYAGCTWVDLDAIEAEASEILETDPAQAERFYGNRCPAGQSMAFDAEAFVKLAVGKAGLQIGRPGEGIAPGRKVVGGFDGSKFWDATGLIVTDIETGHQIVLGHWERPKDLSPDVEWEVPAAEVNEAVDFMFETWDVWRLRGDPALWKTEMGEWAGRHGKERVVETWTDQLKRMAYAIKAWHTSWTSALEQGSGYSFDGYEPLTEHVGNAVRRLTRMRDEETDKFLSVIGKESGRSKRKIDLVMCAVLSWLARNEALAAGVLEEPVYEQASWQEGGGSGRSGRKVTKADYIPCRNCHKPIHPRLHQPESNNKGLCKKCLIDREGVSGWRS
jgi:hypothetical protein